MVFDIGGTNAGVNQSQVNVTGTAKLDGQLALRFSSGYSPAVGASNTLLTASSRSGQFRFLDRFFFMGQNKRMTPTYAPASVLVGAIAAADPTNFTLNVGSFGQTVVVAWSSEFTNHSLYLKTNLADVTWTIIPGVTNLYVESPATNPQKFFRLIP